MYVVGAGKFQAFWDRHPAAKASLRALYALLSEGAWATRAALRTALGDRARDDSEIIEFVVAGARVHLKVDAAAEVILVERVTVEPVEGRKS